MTDANCQECLELLDDYRRGMLPAAERARVEIHLQQCSTCSDELALRKAIALSIRSQANSPVPGVLSPAVLNAIRSTRPTPVPRKSASPLLPAMLAAAIAIIGIIGFVQVRSPQDLSRATISMKTKPAPGTSSTASPARRAQEAKMESTGSEKDAEEKSKPATDVPAAEPVLAQAPKSEAAVAAPEQNRMLGQSSRELSTVPVPEQQMAYFRDEGAAAPPPSATPAGLMASSDMEAVTPKKSDGELRARLSGAASAPAAIAMDRAATPAAMPASEKANRISATRLETKAVPDATPQVAFATSSVSLALAEESSNTLTSATLTSGTLQTSSPVTTDTLSPGVQP